MPLFEMPKRATKVQDRQIASLAKSTIPTMPSLRGGNDLISRINQIKASVEMNLGKYRDKYQVIRNEEILHDFITECIGNQYISIDTETDGLDPLQNLLAGICPSTYGQKGSYIPINHRSYITGLKSKDQLSEEFVLSEFKRLLEKKPEIDMFNAKFDIRFLRAFGLSDIYCTWDGYLASRILNENEEHKNLKWLHFKYCCQDDYDYYAELIRQNKLDEAQDFVNKNVNRYENLFKGIPFTYIPPDIGYLYAANDPVITTELCDYQRKYLTDKTDRQDIKDIYWVFKNIEMPCVKVTADIEDNGILFDSEYAKVLSEQYSNLLKEREEKFYRLCDDFGEYLDKYRERQGANNKLEYPINISSSSQIAIMLYDVLNLTCPDKKNPRATDEKALSKINHPIAKAILDYRETKKLLNTYIDKLPDCVNPNDGRIHCNFNQYGADTGRFSSSDPNLQNIPSHNKDIRKMFVASPGYVLMSSDYSQQEPKVMTQMCQDPKMLDAYNHDKDLYAEIASLSFNKPYADCLEFYLDEKGKKTDKTNKEGKERRSQAKSILLGVLYGRGVSSIAEQLFGTPKDDDEKKKFAKRAQTIKDSVFKGFPAIPQFEQDSLTMAYNLGYVTTLWGRKRRLPDLQLDEFEFKWKNGAPPQDDLLDFTDTGESEMDEVPARRVNYYLKKLKGIWGSDKRMIFEEAAEEGIKIIDNGAKIADAQRQCVNARIQGSAADMSKLAMILVGNDERLKELGFRLLIPVHDELIAECPEENAKECSERFAMLMSKAAGEKLQIPIKCDVEITKQWYGEAINV